MGQQKDRDEKVVEVDVHRVPASNAEEANLYVRL